jgi:hypothetical protein
LPASQTIESQLDYFELKQRRAYSELLMLRQNQQSQPSPRRTFTPSSSQCAENQLRQQLWKIKHKQLVMKKRLLQLQSAVYRVNELVLEMDDVIDGLEEESEEAPSTSHMAQEKVNNFL